MDNKKRNILYSNKVGQYWNNIVLLCLSINKLFPLDKLFIIIYSISLTLNKKIKLSQTNILIILCLTIIASSSFLINFPNSSIQIFYPIIFLYTAILLSESDIKLLTIRKIIFVNILFGIGALILVYTGTDNEFVFSLREKNLPFIYAPYGFSPTQQVFGTFCVLILIISFEYKKYDAVFYISSLAAISTLNRSTLLFMGLLLLVYKPKVFTFIVTSILILIIMYWEEIQLVLFSTSTLDSRTELRRGVEISFWKPDNIFIYLFGKGSSNVTENIAQQTIWERSYIEHGLDFILHAYGFVGLFFIVSIIVIFILYLIKKRNFGLALISFFYLIVEPFFTHEFLASSFFFFITVILLTYKKRLNDNINNNCNI